MTSSLTYGANALDLKLTRTNVLFGGDYGTTPNQVAAGNAVSAGGAGSALYNAAANAYAPATIGTLLDGMSGEIHASLRGAMLENSRLIRGTVLSRLANPSQGTGVWVQGFAEDGALERDGNATEMHRNQAGFLAGFDMMLDEGLRAGIAGSYSGNSVNLAARGSRASGSGGAIIGYVGWRSGALALNLGGDIGWSDTSISRAVAVLGEAAASTRSGQTGEIFAEASYDLAFHGMPLSPYMGLAHVSTETGAFAETGGLTALSGTASGFSQTYATFGLRGRLDGFDLGGMALTPRFGLGLSHAFDSAIPGEILTFRGTGQSFTVRGVPTGTDTALVELGLDLAIAPHAVASFGYDGSFSRGNSHAIRGGLNWQF
jgi:outer membrane autotransporter protein